MESVGKTMTATNAPNGESALCRLSQLNGHFEPLATAMQQKSVMVGGQKYNEVIENAQFS